MIDTNALFAVLKMEVEAAQRAYSIMVAAQNMLDLAAKSGVPETDENIQKILAVLYRANLEHRGHSTKK